jgi:hypothetical protein
VKRNGKHLPHFPLSPPPHPWLALKYQRVSQTKSFAIDFSVPNSWRKLLANVAQNFSTFRVLRPNFRPVANPQPEAMQLPNPLLPYSIFLFTDHWPQEKICDMSLLHKPNAYPFLHVAFSTVQNGPFRRHLREKTLKKFSREENGREIIKQITLLIQFLVCSASDQSYIL